MRREISSGFSAARRLRRSRRGRNRRSGYGGAGCCSDRELRTNIRTRGTWLIRAALDPLQKKLRAGLMSGGTATKPIRQGWTSYEMADPPVPSETSLVRSILCVAIGPRLVRLYDAVRHAANSHHARAAVVSRAGAGHAAEFASQIARTDGAKAVWRTPCVGSVFSTSQLR
jgi:hypothetical protein